MKKLTETQIKDFVLWAKAHGITFRGTEVRRANKGEESTKTWKLLFSLFSGVNPTTRMQVKVQALHAEKLVLKAQRDNALIAADKSDVWYS